MAVGPPDNVQPAAGVTRKAVPANAGHGLPGQKRDYFFDDVTQGRREQQRQLKSISSKQ